MKKSRFFQYYWYYFDNRLDFFYNIHAEFLLFTKANSFHFSRQWDEKSCKLRNVGLYDATLLITVVFLFFFSKQSVGQTQFLKITS